MKWTHTKLLRMQYKHNMASYFTQKQCKYRKVHKKQIKNFTRIKFEFLQPILHEKILAWNFIILIFHSDIKFGARFYKMKLTTKVTQKKTSSNLKKEGIAYLYQQFGAQLFNQEIHSESDSNLYRYFQNKTNKLKKIM